MYMQWEASYEFQCLLCFPIFLYSFPSLPILLPFLSSFLFLSPLYWNSLSNYCSKHSNYRGTMKSISYVWYHIISMSSPRIISSVRACKHYKHCISPNKKYWWRETVRDFMLTVSIHKQDVSCECITWNNGEYIQDILFSTWKCVT
jgi:hypothetical protein